MKKDLEQLFKEYQEFSINTFKNSTAKSSIIGLKREADEVIEELDGINRDYDSMALPIEYADCFMYLIDSMARADVSIERLKEAFDEKLKINANREWKQNMDGSYSHIKS